MKMFDEDIRSVTIDIPKPKVYAKASKDAVKKITRAYILRRPLKNVSIIKYSFPCQRTRHNIFEIEGVLLSYNLYLKQQRREERQQRLAVNIHEHYRIASTDLRMRLHVSDPDEDRRTKICTTDLPVRGHIRLNNNHLFKTLKVLFSNQLRVRQVIGYRKDSINNIDRIIRKENEMYDLSYKRYREQVKCFDEFIANDYYKSMEFLTKWDITTLKLIEKTAELQNLATQKNIIASKILGLDYKYRQQQKYGRFLYYLSPPSWRSQHREFAQSVEIEAKGFDFGITSEEDTFNKIFEILQKELATGVIKPPLYFNQPSDLIQIFERIEQQNLNHFIHVARMAPHATSLKNCVKYLRYVVAQDSAAVACTIRGFEEKLSFCEENCAAIKTKFDELLNGTLYDSVGAPDVLKLNIHLEFTYENIFNEKPVNMDMKTIAKALERMYIEYNKLLDDIDSDKVHHALLLFMNKEKTTIRQAKVAASQLRQYEKLEQALLRAHAPVSKNKRVPAIDAACTLITKTNRQSRKKSLSFEPAKIQLTEIEVEYLSLFTDWTEHESPSKYLHRSSISDLSKGSSLN